MNKTKSFISCKVLIDWVVIVFNITQNMSMLKVWFLDPIPISSGLILFFLTLSAFIYRFNGRFSLFKVKNGGLILLFFTIMLFDVIQNVIVGDSLGLAVSRLMVLLDDIMLMEYTYALYNESSRKKVDALEDIPKVYEYYALYNVFVVVFCAVMILIGVFSPFDHPIEPNSLTGENATRNQYYLIGHLSLGEASMRGLSAFGIPLLTGLSHEPHVFFLLMGPAFYLLLNRYGKRTIWTLVIYTFYFLALIVATSTTAILTFLGVFFVEQLYSLFIGHNKKSQIFILVLLVIGVIALLKTEGATALDDTSQMVVQKVTADDDESSVGYSVSMIDYMLSPKSLIGRGNMPRGVGYNVIGQDIGIITCVLDIIFFILMFYKTIKSVLSKNRSIHYWGMAGLYFMIHMQKLSVMVFGFQLMAFWVIMMVVLDRVKHKEAREVAFDSL